VINEEWFLLWLSLPVYLEARRREMDKECRPEKKTP
jgi:hypothetical protein